DAIEFIMALEVEFEIDIPDEEVEKFKTVQNIVDYVSKNIRLAVQKNRLGKV
ncbi:hypothetical protein PSYMO_35415, partial [Pseudomonas amygdali pv. mori str. 301020]